MVKACSRPRTRKGRRKPKWYENPPAARPCRFESGPGHHTSVRWQTDPARSRVHDVATPHRKDGSMASFIIDNMQEIVAEWESFARTVSPASAGMDNRALR